MSGGKEKIPQDLSRQIEAVNLSEIIAHMLRSQRDTHLALLSILKSDTDAAIDSIRDAITATRAASDEFDKRLDHLAAYTASLEQRVSSAGE